MAPKVVVPMDFGGHLRESPSHNNLKLNTSDGGEVLASSVILSFNSPVIDHMTTTLHMTSVDMLEFSEAAVQVFVDSAYSGTAEGINREIFRDINKIANVFKVAWLVSKCSEYFAELSNSVTSGSYGELLFLFNEAGFVYENQKTKDFLIVAIKKIESLNWKQQFLERYLENAERLSTKKLDTVIELAGNDVNFVVQSLVNQLSEMFKTQGPNIPASFQYLLDNSDLYLCQHSNEGLFNELFDILRELPNDKLRWILDLHRKSTERMLSQHRNATEKILASFHSLPKEISSPRCPSSISKECLLTSRCNTVPNLYQDIDLSLDIGQFFDWLSDSKSISSLLMAIEACWTWCQCSCFPKSDSSLIRVNVEIIHANIISVMERRGWPPLPIDMVNCEWTLYNQWDGLRSFDWRRFCVKQSQQEETHVIINGASPRGGSLFSILSQSSKLIFHFKHPSVTHCSLPGECGFILKTVPSDKPLWKLSLCTEDKDYHSEPVHFHPQIQAENMHIFYSGCDLIFDSFDLVPLSWLGWIDTLEKMNYFTNQFCVLADGGQFKVLYSLMRE